MAEPIVIEWRSSWSPGYLDCARKQFVVAHRKELVDLGFELTTDVPSIGSLIGTAAHKLAANLLRTKRDTGSLLVDDIDEAVSSTWDYFNEELANGSVHWDKTTPHEVTAKKQLYAIAEAMVPACQLIDPIRVEESYKTRLSPLGSQAATVIDLSATIDVFDTRRRLYDHKCGARTPKVHPQAGCYLISLIEAGEDPREFWLNYIPRLGVTKLDEITSSLIPLDVTECVNSAWSALREMQRHYEDWLIMLEEVKAGKRELDLWTIPANEATQNCTPKYCTAYGTNACKIGGACNRGVE